MRKHFLMPRYLRDYLKIITRGRSGDGPAPAAERSSQPAA